MLGQANQLIHVNNKIQSTGTLELDLHRTTEEANFYAQFGYVSQTI